MSVRLYPTVASARRHTILLDLATVVGILVFAWAGVKVHDAVAELSSLGRGVQDAGTAVQQTGRDVGGALEDALGGAGGAVGGAPIVGGTLEDALRGAGRDAGGAVSGAGEDSGGRVAAAGRDGERKAYALANWLGWLTFLLPAGLLLARIGPTRVAGVRDWTAADRVFGAASTVATSDPGRAGDVPPPPPGAVALPPAGTARRDADRAAVLAQRAVASLPYRHLLRHTTDPVGDLLAGRHEALLAALAEHDGVDARPRLAAATG